jgi:hypothetical protein
MFHCCLFKKMDNFEISEYLLPKFAANDRIDIFNHVQEFVSQRFSELSDTAEDELVQFVTKMSSLVGSRKETIMKMDAKNYWNIFGRTSFLASTCARKKSTG